MRRLGASLALLGASGCLAAAEPPPTGLGMNVVIVTADSLRSRSLKPYGYARSTMPALESWAADAAVFPHAYSTSAWTFPGLGSMLTGLYPGRHGLDARGRELRDVPTLQSLLADAGYRVPTVSHLPGTPGFRVVELEPRWTNPTTGKGGTLLEWLASEEAQEAPFFAWDHWRGSHLPYNPPPPFAREFGAGVDTPAAELVRSYVVIPAEIQSFGPGDRAAVVNQYDAQLRWVDERFAELFATLDAAGLTDNTIVVITADHGEALLEHDLVGHASTTVFAHLYEEVIQIPLMIRVPGRALAPPACRTSQVDIMPTILELIGLPAPAGLDGRGLSAAMTGATCEETPLFAETIQGGFQSAGASANTFMWSVLDGNDKLIVTRDATGERVELFALDQDPAEESDRTQANPQVLARLRTHLDAFVTRSGGPGYWQGRQSASRPARRIASEVLSAPEVLDPPSGTTLQFETTGGLIVGRWTGSPAATYVVEYDVGEDANRTQGTFEVVGNRYEFGPVPAEVWRNLSQFNPWRLRLWPKLDPEKKSPWASFTVRAPGSAQ